MRNLGGFLTGQKSPKEIAIERIEKQRQDVLSDIETKCAFMSDFATLFDSFFEHSAIYFVPYEDIQEYCIKKELSANQVIDLNKFGIALNPKHLQVDNFDCSKLIAALKTEIGNSLRELESDNSDKDQRRCVVSALSGVNDYFHSLLAVEFISKLSLNVEQKEQEKQTFVTKMTDIGLKLRKNC